MTAEKTILKCAHCAKEFKYESERKRHEQSHIPQFSCKECSKNFSFLSALRRHEKQHERTGNVQCDKCTRTFRDQALLMRHIKYAHGETYSCSKCDNTFNSEAALRTHMRTHKVGPDRKYRCTFDGCNKAFNFPHHLKHHELTHTNTKLHFCAVCNKGFIQSHHLKTHLKTHNPDRSLYCSFPECNKKFATEFARKRHLTKYHGKVNHSGVLTDSNSTCDTATIFTVATIDFSTSDHSRDETENIKNELNTLHLNTGIIDTPEDLSLGKTKDDHIETYNEISNCKTMIGDCIVDEDDGCVCAQISNTVTKDITKEIDFTPTELEKSKKLSIDDIQFDNPCDGCKCSSHCNVKDIINSGTMDVIPEIEYDNGAIKIKDAFDLDITAADTKSGNSRNDMKFNSYGCTAVLGNCIVSGNGTISEGCLCARMALDEQATAQEIEDITPHPKNQMPYCLVRF